MAEDKDESQEKTQEPTARRLEKAKEDGKVLSSKEAFVFSSMFMGVLLFYLAPMLLDDFLKICKSLFSFGPELASGKSPLESVAVVVKFFIQVFLIFSIPLLVVSVLTQFLIGGINFSIKSIYWKFEKMNPIKGLKRIFSLKGLVELVKAILKVSLLGLVAFFLIENNLSDLVNLTTANIFSAVNRLFSFFPEIIAYLLVVLAFIAFIDVVYQKYDYIKQLRMSHQDLKDEYKETDGQPEVKQKIRKLQAEAATKSRKEASSVDNLEEATAIITNPTHFAVALKYEVGDAKAPIIISKGRGKIAESIIKKGKELKIGTMQSPKLARAIYYTSEIGDEIMSKLYNAVAIALAYIYKIDNGEEIEKPEIEIPEDMIFDEFGRKNDQ